VIATTSVASDLSSIFFMKTLDADLDTHLSFDDNVFLENEGSKLRIALSTFGAGAASAAGGGGAATSADGDAGGVGVGGGGGGGGGVQASKWWEYEADRFVKPCSSEESTSIVDRDLFRYR
jgi:hypothetical protein